MYRDRSTVSDSFNSKTGWKMGEGADPVVAICPHFYKRAVFRRQRYGLITNVSYGYPRWK